MKKNGTKITILLICASLMMIVAIIFTIINYKKKTIEKNMTTIKDAYTTISNESSNNASIRISLNKKMVLTPKHNNYPEEHTEYLTLLNKYDESVNKIINTVEKLEPKCKKEYEDASTNVFCRTYLGMYEETINTYIRTTSEYNDMIKSYNEKNNGAYALHPMIQKEYIDLNGDGYYAGKAGIMARLP